MSILNPLQYPVCFSRPLRLDSISAWVEHIPFGMLLVELLRPQILVELGTHTGVSYCAFCQAVKQLRLDTQCYAVDTWVGDAQSGLYEPNIFANLQTHHNPIYGEFSRLIQSTFDDAVNYFSDASVDLLHIDGVHTYEAVKHDFETWLPKLSQHAVVLIHDTNVRERDFGVWKLWMDLRRNYPHFEFRHGHGLGVLSIGEKPFDPLAQLISASEDERKQIREFFFYLGSRWSAEIAKQNQVNDLSCQLAEQGLIMQALSVRISESKKPPEVPLSELNQEIPIFQSNPQEDADLLRLSGFFDENWYVTNYPDVYREKMDPALHYVLFGGFEGRDPGPLFSSAYYLDTYPDIAMAGVNPLVHYLQHGKSEGRKTQPETCLGTGDESVFYRQMEIVGPNKAELPRSGNPDVSVVVVVYNMAREAPRTLHSLSAAYQRHIDPDDFEIIVVDNGSDFPLDSQWVEGLSGNFRLIRIDDASPSPAQAVNRGLAEARGAVVGVMIDGARIATPGLLHFARHGARLGEAAVVAAPGWYLGYDMQRWAIQYGYDQVREDALLAAIDWPHDGYRLFEVATMDESSVDGWLQPIAEANALFMRRELWDQLGGMDERFDAPGGGLVNLDIYSRAMQLPQAQLVLLLGEGTFHQLHGGIATNASAEESEASFRMWDDQYEKIRGHRFQWHYPEKPPMYVGTLPRPALLRFVRSAFAPAWGYKEPPLGRDFDRQLWALDSSRRPVDPTVAALVELAQQEFLGGRYESTVNIARLIRSRAPDEPEPQRLLSLCATVPGQEPGAESFFALAEAHRVLGEFESAASNYRKALALKPDLVQAHLGLAALRMPGDCYYTWLDRFYRLLSPKTVIEIGIFEGASLARVKSPAIAIGVDPNPTVIFPISAETHIFPETSDEFFARRGPEALLDGCPLGVGFIDGMHLFEQALKDFINLEEYCGPRSMILFHDTVPLDEATQSRDPTTQFHSGDIWKVVLCLKHYRPDLDVFTIATHWTGLTVVTGLDPTSRVLADRYDEAVARFIDMPFQDIQDRLDDSLNIVPNQWEFVEARLKRRQIL